MKLKGRTLTATLYVYAEPINARRAKVKGAEWGSFSNYVNFLIAKDHGDKESMQRSKDMAETALTPREVRAPKPVKKTRTKTPAAPKKTSGKAGKKRPATAARGKADLKSRAKAAVKNIVAKATSSKKPPVKKASTTKVSSHA